MTVDRAVAPSAAAVIFLLLAALAAGCGDPQTETADPGSILTTGADIYASQSCANCHGDRGQGDVGPPLSGVLVTFPDCTAQKRWVSLGSAIWAEDAGSSYGALNKPVNGGMPGFGSRLAEDELAAVVSFTRVEFGSGDPQSVVRACTGG